jgi:nucleoside-diphosphate-sugar epimerase
MTVLVTGAGVIGTLTADLLAKAGESVVLADIRPAMEGEDRIGIARVRLDIEDAEALGHLIEDCTPSAPLRQIG